MNNFVTPEVVKYVGISMVLMIGVVVIISMALNKIDSMGSFHVETPVISVDLTSRHSETVRAVSNVDTAKARNREIQDNTRSK